METVVLGFLLGTILGSFAKALADRSLVERSFWGRSYCMNCKHKLSWYDLFPIISYLFLGGRCRYCGDKIGLEYLLVEVGMGILVGFLFWLSFSSFQFTVYSLQSIFSFQFTIFILELFFKTFFISILVILFLTDLKKMFIPDRIILPAIVISVISIIFITVIKVIYLYSYLSQDAIGKYLLPPQSDYFRRHVLMATEPFLYSILMAILIGGFFYLLIIITKGKGMGGGDVKLGAFLGLMLGFPNALLATILSFVLGAVFSLFLILTGKKHFGQTIAFGPFLVLGSLIALFWGNQIMEWYLHLGT